MITKWCANKHTKGQMKPKADWGTVDPPKKRTNEFVLFPYLFFWDILRLAQNAFGFILP